MQLAPAWRSVTGAAGRGSRLNLLGGFGLHFGGDAVLLPPSAQRLVALLALHDAAMRRDYVAGMLWGDSTEAHANGSLRSALWKVHLARPDLVWNRGGSLGLCPQMDVDVRRVTMLARSIVTGCFSEETIVALLEPRFCHELLPGWYDEWVLVERERHRQLSLHALESLCDHLTAAGRYGAAVLAGLAVDDYPTSCFIRPLSRSFGSICG